MNAFTIKDLENLSGIKAHTLRIWEQRYNFLKPQRTTTNIRYYSNDELKTILNIALLNKYGFKISHIDQMLPGEIKDKILSLGDAKAVQERLINALVNEMIDLNIDKFERIIAGYISAKGIEETILQIIFPFLEKTGILWQTGHINPAQEHLVINIIRQKLIVAIETCASPVHIDKTFLLYLPEGEHHELGLLFMYYLLKSRGAKIIYLGANVPSKDVEYIVKLKKPDIAFIHLTGNSFNFSLEKFLHSIQQRFGKIETVISGQRAEEYRKRVPSCIQLKRSLPEVMNWLSSLR
jgi:MerR family transcriptional regulator, light-induced transcriptional regulator